METKAYVKNVGIGPRKVRLVLDTIRGKQVKEAAAILKFTRTGAAQPVAKLLKSAVSNAVNNNNADENDLYVVKCFADDGQVLKRWMPRAKGNASQILKRSSHVTIVVGDHKEETAVEPVVEETKKAKTKPASKQADKEVKAEEKPVVAKAKKAAAKKVEEKPATAKTKKAVEEKSEEKKPAAKKPAAKKPTAKKTVKKDKE